MSRFVTKINKMDFALILAGVTDPSDCLLEPILKKLLDLKIISGWYYNGRYHVTANKGDEK